MSPKLPIITAYITLELTEKKSTMASTNEENPVANSDDALKKNPFNEEFAKFATETMEEWKVPGISIAVIDDQDVFAEVSANSQGEHSDCKADEAYIGLWLRSIA